MKTDNSLRGRCKKMSEAFVFDNPTYRIVRGFYTCSIWNVKEQHWWTVNTLTEEIYDPTASQYPSSGMGIYEEFDGFFECSQCGKLVEEKDVVSMGNRYVFCSSSCACKLVGL